MPPSLAKIATKDKRQKCLDDLCHLINDHQGEIERSEGSFTAFDAATLVISDLKAAQALHSELAGTTPVEVQDRIIFLTKTKNQEERAKNPELKVPKATADNFWKAAYHYNPQASNPDPFGLAMLLMMGRFEHPLRIGRLFGKYEIALIPQMGALPGEDPPESVLQNTDGYASYVGGGAIIYADGHPSEDDINSQVTPTEERLRRFVTLGFIVLKKSKKKPWEKTGHCLVADLDRGKIGDPWIVLATEWEMDYAEAEAYPDDPRPTHYAEKTVSRGDFTAKGVFPGHRNRTPIAKLVAMSKDQKKLPLMQMFGSNFNVDLERKSGPRLYARNDGRGPDLAYVTDWYQLKNSKDKEIVCYNRKGLEYMRFNPRTQLYSFAGFIPANYVDDVGLFGNLVDLNDVTEGDIGQYESNVRAKKVSLEDRLKNVSISEYRDNPRLRDKVARSIAEKRNWTHSKSLRGSAGSEVW